LVNITTTYIGTRQGLPVWVFAVSGAAIAGIILLVILLQSAKI
jgi:hypothetical protein